MRLIDADVLLDNIRRDSKKAIDEGDKVGSFWLGYAAGFVIKQPTIQPVATDTNVGDTISRQAAIDELPYLLDYDGLKGENGFVSKRLVRKMLKELPPAQPEPKEGHWIDKGWNGDWAWQIDGRGNCWRVIECSECGKGGLVESNYCPHCGARMKGERQK